MTFFVWKLVKDVRGPFCFSSSRVSPASLSSWNRVSGILDFIGLISADVGSDFVETRNWIFFISTAAKGRRENIWEIDRDVIWLCYLTPKAYCDNNMALMWKCWCFLLRRLDWSLLLLFTCMFPFKNLFRSYKAMEKACWNLWHLRRSGWKKGQFF